MAFNWLNQWLAIWLYRFVKQNKFYFAFNSEIEDFLKLRHVKPSSIRYGSQKLEAQNIIKEYKYDAVFLGRFHAQKGIDYIVPFVVELKKSFPDFKLLVIGAGDEKMQNELDRKIQENGLSKNIVCVGQKSGKEKDDLIKQSRIFFFPSTYESFGIVVVEATAMGLPTVAFNLPIFPDLFGDTILTAPLGDVVGLANQAKILLENPEIYQDQVTKSQTLLEKYTWEKTAQTVLDSI
jgi:glycosyltransferase involved in cell wall biosynthesis